MRVEVFRRSVMLEFLFEATNKKGIEEVGVFLSEFHFSILNVCPSDYWLVCGCFIAGIAVQNSCKNVCYLVSKV
jgi:hypothetical protein